MKVAMTIWGNRISPVFDSAQSILLAEVLDKTVVERKFETIPFLIPIVRARKIIALEPDTLICGAISNEPARLIESAGITLLAFISGKAEPVLQSYIREQEIDTYRMPGCRGSDRCCKHGYQQQTR